MNVLFDSNFKFKSYGTFQNDDANKFLLVGGLLDIDI